MKFGNMLISNYCTYTNFKFNFRDLGLALVYGATGSGKSTVLDMACWILFGKTAKGTAADEVRPWGGSEMATIGTLEVETSTGAISVSRTRVKSNKDNDLSWTEYANTGEPVIRRGKDNTETQKLLEKRLGISYDLYVTGAYFHEFSPAGNFFLSNSKARRQVFEDVADMSLAVSLGEKASEHKKLTKKSLTAAEMDASNTQVKVEQAKISISKWTEDFNNWEVNHLALLKELSQKHKFFEENKNTEIKCLEQKAEKWLVDNQLAIKAAGQHAKVMYAALIPEAEFKEALDILSAKAKCLKCGQVSKETLVKIDEVKAKRSENTRLLDRINHAGIRLQAMFKEVNPHLGSLANTRQKHNSYTERLAEAELETNPYADNVAIMSQELKDYSLNAAEAKAKEIVLKSRLASLNRLYELSYALRGQILKNTVSQIQDSTNGYLEKYFDSEFRINLSIEDGDNLEVNIQKSGNDCSYQQLSKGQRQLLKLTFAVSLMQVANQTSIEGFQDLAFDEALDGLDEGLKVKAYDMFQELAKQYQSILVIDHNTALQNLFDKRFHVELVGDHSVISEES